MSDKVHGTSCCKKKKKKKQQQQQQQLEHQINKTALLIARQGLLLQLEYNAARIPLYFLSN